MEVQIHRTDVLCTRREAGYCALLPFSRRVYPALTTHSVIRTSGIRDYQEEDLKWVEMAVCMRSAGKLFIQHCLSLKKRSRHSTICVKIQMSMQQCEKWNVAVFASSKSRSVIRKRRCVMLAGLAGNYLHMPKDRRSAAFLKYTS